MYLALNLIGEAVFFFFRTDINERLAQFLSHEGTLSDASCSHAGNDIDVAEMLVDKLYEALADESPDFGIGKGDAVVAIDGGFAA